MKHETKQSAVFPTGPDGLPIYPSRGEAIAQIEILTAERDEAVAWLRAISHDISALRAGQRDGYTFGKISGTDDAIQDFLTRLDKAEKECVLCGQVGVGPCGCGFQNEKAGAR